MIDADMLVKAIEIYNVLAKDVKFKAPPENSDSFFVIGEAYFVRTITMIYTGRLIQENQNEITLVECAWIADTGRFADAFRTGKFDEVEPYPDKTEVVIQKGAIVDYCMWPHPLPREQQ